MPTASARPSPQLVGAPIQRPGTGASAAIYGYWSGLEPTGYEWIFRPDACAGMIPTNDGKTCVFVGATPARIGRGGRAVLDAVLAAASPEAAARVHAAIPPTGVRTFTGLRGFVRRAWGPGWALVGDAGYWKDPHRARTGSPTPCATPSCLARADRGRRGRATATEAAALADYQATRDRLSLPLFDIDRRHRRAALGRRRDRRHSLLRLSAAMADEVEHLAALDGVAAR